LGFKALNQRHR